MAKTTNPLFSLSASGTVGRITHISDHGRQTARARTFRHPAPPSALQQQRRNATKDAATAWAALPPDERAMWTARGVACRYASDRENAAKLHNGWALWLKEWHLQQATLTRLPMLPAV